MTVHFGPPAGLLVTSDEVKDSVAIQGIPPGTLLIKPWTVKVDSLAKSKGNVVCTRTGLKCVSAFAMTAHKAQGKTFDKILVDLSTVGSHGKRNVGFESLYVQLSRATSWEGIFVNRPMDRQAFLNSKLDPDMSEGLQKLDQLASATRRSFESLCDNHDDQRLRSWYQQWRTMDSES